MSEPRIAPLPAEEWGEAEYAAVAALFGIQPEQVARAGSGAPGDPSGFAVLSVLVRHPDLARAFFAFNRHQLSRTFTLTPRQRELVILRVAARRRSAYEWGQHVDIARRTGITDAEIGAVASDLTGIPRAELSLLQAADELLDEGAICDTRWERLTTLFDVRQLMDLVFLVGTYSTLAMAFKTFGLQPEPGSAPLP